MNTQLHENVYYDGTWKAARTGHYMLQFSMEGGDGTFYFANTPTTQTADTAISGKTYRMKIDKVGNITSACPSGCSDERSKTSIKDITDALDVVTAMRGVSFNWKDSTNMSPERQIGFIGQQMEEILPEVVTTGEWNGIEDYKSIKYDCIVPILAEAIKELKAEKDAQIEQLKARLAALEAKL